MNSRWYPAAVSVCWLAAMGWLMVEKILPTLTSGDPPDIADVLPAGVEQPAPSSWSIHYNGRIIGYAHSQAVRHEQGGGHVTSVVTFDRLPLGEILSESVGTIGLFAKALLPSEGITSLSMTVESRLWISTDDVLDRFNVSARLQDSPSFIEVRGRSTDGGLRVEVYAPEYSSGGVGEMQLRYSDELQLPEDALVMSSLSPQTQLRGLRVGQRWTFPSYRPFPPDQPVQLVAAKVLQEQPFIFDGETVSVALVVLYDEAGSGISVASEPIGKLWVLPDGTVLQQETQLANLKLRFRRLPNGVDAAAGSPDIDASGDRAHSSSSQGSGNAQ